MLSCRIAFCAELVLNVAIEARMSSAFPIWRLIIVGPRTGSHEAEEDVFRWLDNDSRVPTPDNQVSGLRLLDALETFDAGVEIGGRGIRIRKASLLVDSMNEMRAVVFGIAANSGIERGGDQGKAVVIV